MTLMEAAKKWNLSPNWVRELVKSDRIKGAKLNTSGPVPFYDIPDNAPKPPSMARYPLRAGQKKPPKPESIAQRKSREKARASK